MSRLTKAEMLADLQKEGVAVLEKTARKDPSKRSTLEFEDALGNKYLRYSHTNVITWYPNGNVQLETDGWRTVTTKARINDSCHSIRISQTEGEWYLTTAMGTYPFFDGVLIDSNGNILNGSENTKEQEERARLKKLLTKGLKKLDEIPHPCAGDCWICMMSEVQILKENPRAKLHDNTHIISHIEEGYYHGTLHVAALLWAGFRSEQIQFVWGIDQKRRLRRYLLNRIGFAV